MSDVTGKMATQIKVDTSDPLVQQQVQTGNIIESEEDLNKIKSYLTDEILNVLSGAERGRLQDKWEKWRRQSESRPEQESKSYPWDNASNVTPPLAMTNSHGIYALLKNSLNNRSPFWSVTDTTKTMQDEANAIEAFLTALAESPHHLNLKGVNNVILYDLARLGTQFVKIPWVIDRRPFKQMGPGGSLTALTQTVKDSPGIIPVKIEDVITRPFWYDVQTMPYIGRRVWIMEHTLRARASQGIYLPDQVELVISGGAEAPDDRWTEMLSRAGIDPSSRDTQMYPIFEMNYFYDIDGDGVAEDIIVWVDVKTQAVLRVELNELGMRDWVRIPYFDLPYELYAMGTGWMVESLQDEAEALHNIGVNSMHISSLQMYVTKRGSRVAPGQKFRPLLNIEVDNPAADFLPIKFPDIGYSIMQREAMVKEYADKATGVSDAMLGFENSSISSRTTLGGTMFLAGQGTKAFASVLPNVEDAYAQMGQIVLYRCIQEKDRLLANNMISLIPPELQAPLQRVLDLPLQDIPNLFNFNVSTTEQEKSEEAKKQNLLTMTQLYTMYGKQVFELLPMVYNPQVPPQMKEVALKFFTGATELMDEILTDFGEQDTRKYLPYVKNIEMMLNAMDMQKSAQIGGGNVQGNGGQMGIGGGPNPAPGGAPGGQQAPPTPQGPVSGYPGPSGGSAQGGGGSGPAPGSGGGYGG